MIQIGKMNNETAGVAIEEFVGLKPNWFLVDDSSKHKKSKGVIKNVVATISHNEYKYVLLNNKCLRHSLNKSKVKIIEWEPMKLKKFLYYTLILKYVF